MILRYDVKESDSGRKVYSIMRRDLVISAALTRRLKQVDAISLNGQPVFTDRLVSPGDTVTVDIAAAEPACDNIPETGTLDILYEDEGLIAVNKQPGMLTHPSRARYTGTLANIVAGYLKETTGNGCCHAVNRLDRDTSGVVLFAKNSHMKARASKALAAADSDKEYIALVLGVLDAPAGTINRPIRRQCEGEMRRITAPDGQRAVTHYETVGTAYSQGNEVSLLRLRLETGRTHQIRVHMHDAGHPVLGDILYNTDKSRSLSEILEISTQALHARRLAFTDPVSGGCIELTAPVPQLFAGIRLNSNDR
ncbi:MAG: RluA family pseudouridine synthase [Clostridiales bacterium]|nr:RluA family pseudouridine synthase [Clostridiales bacterium]